MRCLEQDHRAFLIFQDARFGAGFVRVIDTSGLRCAV